MGQSYGFRSWRTSVFRFFHSSSVSNRPWKRGSGHVAEGLRRRGIGIFFTQGNGAGVGAELLDLDGIGLVPAAEVGFEVVP